MGYWLRAALTTWATTALTVAALQAVGCDSGDDDETMTPSADASASAASAQQSTEAAALDVAARDTTAPPDEVAARDATAPPEDEGNGDARSIDADSSAPDDVGSDAIGLMDAADDGLVDSSPADSSPNDSGPDSNANDSGPDSSPVDASDSSDEEDDAEAGDEGDDGEAGDLGPTDDLLESRSPGCESCAVPCTGPAAQYDDGLTCDGFLGEQLGQCLQVLACALDAGCGVTPDDASCFCGDDDASACATAPTGPCAAYYLMNDASADDVLSNFQNVENPSGMANLLVGCVQTPDIGCPACF